MATIWAISRGFNPTSGIETGTFLGSSTPYLASMVTSEMFTIEIQPKTASLARERFRLNHLKLPITLKLGDSVNEIQKILSGLNPKTERIIAYLDAHWYDAIPTTAEISALLSWGGPWIAIIDDFKVESDSGYKYDVYGAVEIGPSIVPDDSKVCIYVPNEPSSMETGRRKGTGYVCRSSEEFVLREIPELTKIR